MGTGGRLIFIKGLPKSGKSSLAAKLAAETGGEIVRWRHLCGGGSADLAKVMIATAAKVRVLLRAGRTVIVDEENLYGASFWFLQTLAQLEKCPVAWLTARCSVEECKKRSLAAGELPEARMRIDMLSKFFEAWSKR